MMPSRQKLLLPVNPTFIWGSLLAALLLNMLPFGRTIWMPDFLALVLVFWNVRQPLRIGIGIAFMFGLAMDVNQSALLGQHALSYTALSFLATMMHRRVLWFSLPSQALQLLPVFMVAHAMELLIRMVGGGVFPGAMLLLAPVIEAVLWPVVSVLLLAPQRRAHDPDQNRPI